MPSRHSSSCRSNQSRRCDSVASFAGALLFLLLLSTDGIISKARAHTAASKPQRRTIRGMGGTVRGLKFADAPEGFQISNNDNNNNNSSSNKKEHLRNRRQQRKLQVSPIMLVTNGEVYPEDWILLEGNTYTTAPKTAKKDKDKGIFGPRPKGKDKEGSPPTPAPFDSSNIDESETDGTGNSVCLAVVSQEPVDAEASTRAFSISVDVVYQTDTTSSTEIASLLDDQNLAMALWIAGCEEEANALIITIDTAPGKRRTLQEEVVINYSQVDTWTTTGGLGLVFCLLLFSFAQNNHPRRNFFRSAQFFRRTERCFSSFLVSCRFPKQILARRTTAVS